jgi:post-segregation antitoxin (ccd killing protein)
MPQIKDSVRPPAALSTLQDAGIGADGYFDEKDWARDNYVAPNDHLTEAHTEEKFVHASSFIWFEPYKRPMKLTLRFPDYPNTETELDVLAADDVESVVQSAMQVDANRTAEAKQARLDISSNVQWHVPAKPHRRDDRWQDEEEVLVEFDRHADHEFARRD